MKLRLAILNIAVPLIMLLALHFLPTQQAATPTYLIIGLLVFSIARAYLLLLQQTIFAILPVLLLVLPNAWTFGFDGTAPFVIETMLLYLTVVNLQWNQRPWRHKLHLVNGVLLLAAVLLGFKVVQIPADLLAYDGQFVFWSGLISIIMVVCFSMYWQRHGRWAALWPMLGVWAYTQGWADYDHALLWVALAVLVTLTVDGYAMAFIDELTGIPGRRAMEFKLKTMDKQYLLAMADVDHFKKFNDNHGHQVGDDVLKMVANVLSKTTKGHAYRYGGEEFILIFSNSDSEDVSQYLEETREKLEQYPLYPKSQQRQKNKRGKGSERKPLHITASFGLARQKGSEPYHEVISRADKALYKAKDKGRNRIEIAK
jgi:diguanylate cyclase (GGDEF)-like protein